MSEAMNVGPASAADAGYAPPTFYLGMPFDMVEGRLDLRYYDYIPVTTKRLWFRSMIWERDGGKCGLCGGPVDYDDMDLDHIVPRSLGGPDHWDNLQVSHPTCNRSKGNRRA